MSRFIACVSAREVPHPRTLTPADGCGGGVVAVIAPDSAPPYKMG